MNTASVFEDIELEIDNKSSSLPFNVVSGPDEFFGVCKITVKKTNINKCPIFMLFTIDNTGSMSEVARGMSRKIDHLKQTFVNMMVYLVTLEKPIYIQVDAFNTVVSSVIPFSLLTKETVGAFVEKIQSLVPDGCTDIENAIKTSSKVLDKYINENPENQCVHIFMTDGSATAGETDQEVLADFINSTVSNVFIGFGHDHNAVMLRRFSKVPDTEYLFVDNTENTALVYGETIHQFIYPAVECVELSIENGELYDWQTNTWTTALKLKTLVSEAKKTYHFRTKNRSGVQINIHGKVVSTPSDYVLWGDFVDNSVSVLETIDEMPDLIDINGMIVDNGVDLTKYAYRQKVQELLYTANNYSKMIRPAMTLFKDEMKTVFRKLSAYIRENDLEKDGLLKMLKDDLYIIFKTVDDNRGIAYSSARQSSQGREKSYNTSTIDSIPPPPQLIAPGRQNSMQRQNSCALPSPPFMEDEHDTLFQSPPVLRRQNAIFVQNDDSQSILQEDPFQVMDTSRLHRSDSKTLLQQDELEFYVPDNNATTFYATPSVLKTMRCMSQTPTTV